MTVAAVSHVVIDIYRTFVTTVTHRGDTCEEMTLVVCSYESRD